MAVENRKRYGVADRLNDRPATNAMLTGSAAPIATLSGRPLLSNRGIPLSLDWLKQVRINTSAVERRAQTHVARRTVKKDWQAAWLLRFRQDFPPDFFHSPSAWQRSTVPSKPERRKLM